MRWLRPALALTFFVALAATAPGHAQTKPPSADVELVIRGQDLRPLADIDIVVAEPFTLQHFGDLTPPLALHTDARGVVRFRYPAGVSRLSVAAPGFGYALLGRIEFAPGPTVTPALPPLVPFAHVEGTLPPQARDAGLFVHARPPMSFDKATLITVTPDANGRFALDLEAGEWLMSAGPKTPTGGNDVLPGRLVTVQAGQVVHDLDLDPEWARSLRASMAASPPPPAPAYGPGDQTIVWVRGTVRDEAGHPVPDATILARVTYYGGIRMNEEAAKAATDADGRYALEGSARLRSVLGFGATLLAIAPDRPPAWAWPEFPRVAAGAGPESAPLPAPPVADFVMTAQTGKLDVTLLDAGRPVSGIPISAVLETVHLRETWALPVGGEAEAKMMEDVAEPIAVTGPDGIAHFDRLLPGLYDLHAGTQEVVSRIDELQDMRESETASATGIPVRIGETTATQVAVFPKVYGAPFRILQADGTALSGKASLRFGRVDATSGQDSATLDASGVGLERFDGPGLWHLEAAFRATPIDRFPIEEPYSLAAGTVAVSPLLDRVFTPSLTARRIEPASAIIRVRDAAGRPLHAAVEIGKEFPGTAVPNLDVEAAGSTDESGDIRFAGLTPDDSRNVDTVGPQTVVRASAPGYEKVDLGDGEAPLPAIEKLRHRTAILAHPTVLNGSAEAVLTLRPEAVGYVYGAVHLAPGEDPATSYPTLWLDAAEELAGAVLRYQRATGQFVAGPFRPGIIHLTVINGQPSSDDARMSVAAEIQPGEVTEMEVTEPPRHETAEGWRSQWTGWPRARVFLADGVTPALGAELLYYDPKWSVPVRRGMTDASGDAQSRAMRLSSGDPLGHLDSRVIVARLPGTTGAAITPVPAAADQKSPADPVRITLPPPVGAQGQVTIGGKPPADPRGTIRIRAAHQDQGALDEALSLETVADADGRFAFAGLSPGRYEVQAALDDIWLSPAASIEVRDRDLPPIILAIQSPGAPVLVHLLDQAGRPAIGAALILDQPSGPLTASLWPKQWISDGAGMIVIPTLEAGRHGLHTAGAAGAVAVDVPPLPAGAVEVTMTLGGSLAGTSSP
jgi:hypothetical protein